MPMTATSRVDVPDRTPTVGDVDARAVVTIRMLAADAVERAGSGHPGLPMGAATAAYALRSRTPGHPETGHTPD